MGMHVGAGSGGTSRRGRRKKHAPIAEINVTPFVDVMLVLLIVFMVSAPLMVTGVPIELPKTSDGVALPAPKSEPLVVSVKSSGEFFLGETPIGSDDLVPKLKAIAGARKEGDDVTVYVRGQGEATYGTVAQLISKLRAAGITNIGLVTEPEQ